MYGKIVLVAASALSLATASTPSAVPYLDADCTRPLTGYTYQAKGGTLSSKPFDTGRGVSANHNGTVAYETYSQIKLYAGLNGTQTGNGMFWKMKDLGDTCRVLFMRPFPEQSSVPGAVILNAGSPDACYFADTLDKIQMSFCCGTHDCAAFNVGDNSLNARSLPEPVRKADPVTAVADNKPTPPKLARASYKSSGSISARALAVTKRETCHDDDQNCFKNAWSKCKVTVKNDPPVSFPGKQTSIGGWVDCIGKLGPCEVDTTNTNTYSYSVAAGTSVSDTTGTSSTESSSQTNSQTNTIEVTNTDGTEMKVGASVGFGPFSASTEFGAHHETTNMNTNTNTQTTTAEQSSTQAFSQTLAKSYTQSATSGSADSTTMKHIIAAGGYGIVTFTPTYDCYTIEVDCGEGTFFKWTEDGGNTLKGTRVLENQICVPAMDQSNHVRGNYEVMYSNRT